MISHAERRAICEAERCMSELRKFEDREEVKELMEKMRQFAKDLEECERKQHDECDEYICISRGYPVVFGAWPWIKAIGFIAIIAAIYAWGN